MGMDENVFQDDQPSRWLAVIDATAISPADAKEFVNSLFARRRRRHSDESLDDATPHVANAIIRRYAKMAALTGATTAIPGAVPGVGTMVAVGAGAIDVTVSMKFQVDMCRCMAVAYGYDLTSEDAKHLTMLVAFSGTAEKMVGPAATRLGSKAGVKIVREYLKGAALKTLKELLKKIGITLTRKSIEKAIPFGVGIAVSSTLNYALTRYVGREAKKFFAIDADDRVAATQSVHVQHSGHE